MFRKDSTPKNHKLLLTVAAASLLLFSLLFAGQTLAQPPAGYYDTVDLTTAGGLRSTLHEVIDDHTRYPYTASSTDTWDIINLADEDPNDTGRIIDIYKNASYTKIPGGVGAYNREHSWPKSYGFPDDSTSNYPYTDCHHLFASDASYNSSRSNKPFRNCDAGCSENVTLLNDGRGGGSGVYPGNSNWTTGSFAQGTWETWGGRKGDVARAILYMDIRYEGGNHGVTGAAEPDLRLTDDDSLIDSFNTGVNESVAYMGLRSVLLQWHFQDPVDARELYRNEIVYMFQGNRNPFIDHPEWVDCLYNGVCGGGPDVFPPAAPTQLAAIGGDARVDLTWAANNESDLAGYNVYRSTSAGGPYTKQNSVLVTSTGYADTGLTNGTTYFYVVAAVDTSGNISADSNEAFATPQESGGGGPGQVILSEVLYDVSSGDDGLEWIELFNSGSSAVDLSTYSLGNGGTDYTYSLVQLSGVLAPGATFVVGGPTSNSSNANPTFDLTVNFSPDLQNSGTTGDGVALFDVPANQVTAATVPIDAVIYGPNNNSNLIDESGTANAPEVSDATAGSSIERIDLQGNWQIQSSPNPNATPLGGGSNLPPTAVISSPSNGAVFSSGQAISFTGSASDGEDGDLTSNLVWTSDLDGQIGSGGAFSVVLSTGLHQITASVVDSGGLSDSSVIGITVQGSSQVEVTFTSIGSEDGWVRESSENSNVGSNFSSTNTGTSALRGGDNRRDRQYKAILSFDTSSIPDGAAIVSATVRLQRGRVTGTNPFQTHGSARVDISTGGFGGNTTLSGSDFEAPASASQVAILSDAPANLDWSEGILDAAGNQAIHLQGRTQLRIQFDLDDNDDGSDDYIGYYSGDNGDSSRHPQLVVVYQE